MDVPYGVRSGLTPHSLCNCILLLRHYWKSLFTK